MSSSLIVLPAGVLQLCDLHMIGWMNLSNCRRLCDNLAGVAKMKKIVLCLVVLSSLFLSQQSVFEVVFPGNEVPKWFSCCRDLKERSEFEVAVEIPPNFKGSKTGLALCAAVEIKQNRSGNCCLIARVNMDEECSHEHAVYFDSKERSQLTCGCIIPFHIMIAKTRSGLPPYKFQVSFELTIKGSVFFESCGVHLVIKDDLPVPKTKFFLKSLPSNFYVITPLSVEELRVVENCVFRQIWVYGNNFESFLVAVVVPDRKALEDWADYVKT